MTVVHAGVLVADTHRAVRVLETSQAPAYYLPPDDVRIELLVSNPTSTWCEWKGRASYFDVVVGEVVASAAAWSYPEPSPPYLAIAGYVAFYPQRVDECWVDGERVRANEGGFYGGWVTSRVVGPFKGGPDSSGW